ncbi:MAG: T9SS type A sorting domain-containing protein [Ignavibacteria bacterium]|nr:T9SS type A sorting domain-containing protein [Ignavibacteria bacterium]
MRTKLFLLISFICLGLLATSVVQAQNNDIYISPNSQFEKSGNPNYNPNLDLVFGSLLRNQNVDTLISVAVGYGVTWTGNYYVVSSFNTNQFWKIRPDWSLIALTPLTGGTGTFRDMAFAKGFLWGVSVTNTIFKVDTTTFTQVGTIPLPSGIQARALAWDSGRNAFWVSTASFNGFMRAYDTLGVAIAGSDIPVASNAGAFYGASYDNVSPGGPYLWISSDATPTTTNSTKFVRWRVATLPPVRVDSIVVTVPLTTGAPLASGGSEFATNLVSGKSVLIGVVQGTPDRCIVVEVGDLVGITNNNTGVPSGYNLSQNYPNPFNPNTTFNFGIPTSGNVKLSVMDVLGREVAVLTNEFKTAGSYNVNFDASKLSSGIYFYTLSAGSFKETKKMLLVK